MANVAHLLRQNEKQHDFKERLAWAESHRNEPFWEAAYKKAFPTMDNQMPCPGNTQGQQLGIDRVITLSSGRVLKLDEKLRDRNDDSDILLEYLSNDQTNAPGWIEKQLQIDYLAYGFLPLKKVYLFPWEMLQLAWVKNKEAWFRVHQKIPAKNATYTTWCLAIPTRELRGAVAKVALIEF